ncbi:MAG: helix-turn-helix domain-containing protein [Acidobacteria bacterium]|nr:helix-turn-helix domain-containing protein [Acidobacteriota bacterium]
MATDHKFEADGFLKDLGQRVRTLRNEGGRSIHDLAGQAGLSPRFLSELEAGRGNISVARLLRVASALELPLQSLIPANKKDVSLRGRVLELVEGCGGDSLDELYKWLSERLHKPIPRSIALVGVRGAGKSTVGRLLARRLGIRFVEFDALLERQSGLNLVQMFTLHGEGYYGQLQHDVMEKFLASAAPAVIATGGSLVTDRETWAMVRRQCHTVWLKARTQDHWNRVVAQGDIRPMRNNPAAKDELKVMLKIREPLYSQAELVMETWRHPPEKIVELVMTGLGLVKAVKGKSTAPGNPQNNRPARSSSIRTERAAG